MNTASNSVRRDGRSRFAVSIGAIGVFVILAIIAWFVSQRSVDARHVRAHAAVQHRGRLITRLQAENERLKADQRELLAELPAFDGHAAVPESAVLSERDATRVAAIQLLVELETIGAISQNTSLHDIFRVDRQGRLPDGFVRFFDLSSKQVEKLHSALSTTRQALEATAIAGTTVRRESDAMLVLEIKVAAEWAVQREHLRIAFQEVLGPEQMRALDRLGRNFDRLCANMETQDWSTVVTRRSMSANPDDGFGYELTGTNRRSVRSTRSPGVPRNTIESSLGRWAKFLPADF